jgi:uncharacterized membrane protein YgdD (TMEM256/DUF423 family)
MTWPEVCLSLIGFYLAFFVPFAIFMAVVIRKKIKPTPLIASAGCATAVFFGLLILLPLDSRMRQQYSWPAILAIAFFLGLSFFVGPVVLDHFQSVVLGRSRSGMLVKELQSWLGKGIKASSGQLQNDTKESTEDVETQ